MIEIYKSPCVSCVPYAQTTVDAWARLFRSRFWCVAWIVCKDGAKASILLPDGVRARARARARSRRLGSGSMSAIVFLRLARGVLEKTRAKQQVDKCLGVGAKWRDVVSQFWSRAVSNTHDDILNLNLSFGRKAQVPGAQGNWGRACTPNVALRKALKHIGDSGRVT